MSLLALIAAGGRSASAAPPPTGTPIQPVTYPGGPFPIVAPYNVAVHTDTPTDDGTGQSIHPSIVDFGRMGWNGHRFWATTTAFKDASNARENPHVYFSDDGFTWAWPPGVTNPLDPWPGAADNNLAWYNSDSHLAHDPATGRLILTWREVQTPVQRIWARTSLDGSTWTEAVLVQTITDDNDKMWTVSQSLVHVAGDEWRLYYQAGTGTAEWCRFFTSTTGPLGPFTNPRQVTYSGGLVGYHGTIHRRDDGAYYGIVQAGGKEYPVTSTDGVSFTTGRAILQAATLDGFQQNMYKSDAMIDALDPSMVNVWYTTHSDTSGRWVCRTRVPLAEWGL